jgi:peptide/nickel transport system ATP-binding protein
LPSGAAEPAGTAHGDPALTVDGLRIEFPGGDGVYRPVVEDLSFSVRRGETLGVVGESGSGKTMTALALMGLVPKPGRVAAGAITVHGRRVDGLSPRRWSAVRGRQIGMVFQDALSGLNPVRSVGAVLVEAIRRHQEVSRAEARRLAIDVLGAVGIPKPDERFDVYPHQLSGGLRQRVMIALAIVNHPEVVIADEPTTALDATIQAQILELLAERVADAALVLITHDLGVAASICDRIAVIYAGRLAEVGSVDHILSRPRHPYTVGLIAAVPTFEPERRPMVPIPGAPPSPHEVLPGCAFAPRCFNAIDRCPGDRPPLQIVDERLLACWNPHRG